MNKGLPKPWPYFPTSLLYFLLLNSSSGKIFVYLKLTTVLYAGRVGLRICQYVNLQDRELLLHRLVPRSEVFYFFMVRAFRLPHDLPFSVVSTFFASSFLTGYFRPFFSGHSFSHQFCSYLTAFFAALSFSILSRLGRLFYRPALVARYAVKQPSHRGLVAFYAYTGWVTTSVVQVLFFPTGRFLAALHASRSPSLTVPIAAFGAAICTGSLTARFPAS